MKKLVVFNLFVVTTYITYGQVTNSFPPIGIPTIGGSNYMSINNRLFFQSKNQDINGYNRGVVANNLYWDSAQSKWTNGTSASYDFALLRFESGGNIGFFNGPTPNPSARQTFTNDELETYRTLTLKSTGRVGIGTANPATVLSVFKNSDAADFGVFPSIEINNPNTVGGAYSALIFKSGNTNSTIGVRGAIGELLSYAYNNSTDRYLWLRTLGSSYKLYLGYNKEDFVVSNGNISIGTEDTKGYKLAVNGSAIFTKAVVKTYAT